MKKLLKRMVTLLLAAAMVFSFDIVGTTRVDAATKPSITLKSVTNITNINARINATIKNPSKTKITKVGFILYNSSGTKLAEKSESISNSSTSFNAWYDMNKWYGKLSPNTTYKYKFYVKNSSGTYYSSQGSFKTAANPSITVNSVTNLTSTNAQINATVKNSSGLKITKIGFILYNSSGSKLTEKSESVSKSSGFSMWYDMNKWYGTLKANTTYKYKFYVKTSAGTYYSSEKSFTTPKDVSISTKISSFISDSRWKDGVTWGDNQQPKLAKKLGIGCNAYIRDFLYYVNGYDLATSSAKYTKVTSASSLKAGDAVHFYYYNSKGEKKQHWFVVLSNDGTNLYTAEGNFNDKVSISKTRYTIKNGKLYYNGSAVTFDFAWRYKG